jgi:hypothetical protein
MVEATGYPDSYIEVRVHAAKGDADLAGPWHPITISDPACRGEGAVDSANELVEFVIPGVVCAAPVRIRVVAKISTSSSLSLGVTRNRRSTSAAR